MPKLANPKLKKVRAIDIKFSEGDYKRVQTLADKMRTNPTDAVRRSTLDRCEEEDIK